VRQGRAPPWGGKPCAPGLPSVRRTRILRICPSCYRRNRAWVTYARCPFCGTPGRPIPDVVGPGWPAALAEMLRVTETALGSHPKSRNPLSAPLEAAAAPLEDGYNLAVPPKCGGAVRLQNHGNLYALSRQSTHAREDGERSWVVGRNHEPQGRGLAPRCNPPGERRSTSWASSIGCFIRTGGRPR
jgi:hypothetical protein